MVNYGCFGSRRGAEDAEKGRVVRIGARAAPKVFFFGRSVDAASRVASTRLRVLRASA